MSFELTLLTVGYNLPKNGMTAWFKSSKLTAANEWSNSIGNSGKVTITGAAQIKSEAGHGAKNAVTALTGSTSVKVEFADMVRLTYIL